MPNGVQTVIKLRITNDGASGILNGRHCWIYQHEIFHDHNAIWWAPDGKKLAFFRTDESHVQSVPIHTFYDDYSGSIKIKYPKTGTINPSVELVVLDLELNLLKSLYHDLEYINAVQWTEKKEVIFRVTNRLQNKEFVLVYSTISNQTFTFLSQEEPNGWVEMKDMKYIGNSELLMIKNISGFYHIVVVDVFTGVTTKILTSGNWDVTQLVGFNSQTRILYFLSSEVSPLERHLYSILVPTFEDTNNTNPNKLTEGQGYHSVLSNQLGTYFIITLEGPSPPSQALYKTNSQGIPFFVSSLEGNEEFLKNMKEFYFPDKIFLKVPSHDPNITLNAEILIPPGANPNQRYGLLVHANGAPGSQSVLYKWSYGFDEYVASALGLVVARIDTCGTGARGTEFMYKTYQHLGAISSADYAIATEYLINNIVNITIDRERVGIWGSNIGGHIVLSSLIHQSSLFKAGIALDPITDWTLYDSVYTERYMLTPKANPAGYRETDILSFIPGLTKANFLLIHGTEYNEVYSQNTAKLKKLLAIKGLQYITMSCIDWIDDDKVHFYKMMMTYLESELGEK